MTARIPSGTPSGIPMMVRERRPQAPVVAPVTIRTKLMRLKIMYPKVATTTTRRNLPWTRKPP